MYTGIVKGRGLIQKVNSRAGLSTLTVEVPHEFLQDLEIGGSVSLDGVCLTTTSIDENSLTFDVMLETLNRTTLGGLKDQDEVNIERSARDGAEIGGHPISGHVDCVAQIVAIDRPENNHVVTFKVQPEWIKYIFPKGFLSLNGASLTIAAVDRSNCTFTVWFIPETLRITTFGFKKLGDLVNVEVERGTQVMVDTVRGFLEEKFGAATPQIESILKQLGMSSEQAKNLSR